MARQDQDYGLKVYDLKKENTVYCMQKTTGRPAKPKLTNEEQIEYMYKKRISFSICKRIDALIYLEQKANYFRLKAYCKDYRKYDTSSEKAGLYVSLDFAYLKELSTLDMYLREIILKMTIDIEHFLKVKMLNDLQKNGKEDGYQIVNTFFDEYSDIKTKIQRMSDENGYTSVLAKKYLTDMPMWVLVELLSL
jgi:abortive infection bacteriophage resistance protein